ncbi:hypothetical protein HYH03_007969 [Edaphochlamys debaryana]|uniref:Uncharacterized protein n=1 Tax=Edaphochlamys debaryana TaxID=47281 RepID=A0A835Y430_9CHLO|nr:hypothetical protein HYH03_007969 [Edaphochlamys debaryana]|eukprot:KAG2493746.1 hypothetical protein HYH03_007969 [Edaphochlamys debaryana]
MSRDPTTIAVHGADARFPSKAPEGRLKVCSGSRDKLQDLSLIPSDCGRDKGHLLGFTLAGDYLQALLDWEAQNVRGQDRKSLTADQRVALIREQDGQAGATAGMAIPDFIREGYAAVRADCQRGWAVAIPVMDAWRDAAARVAVATGLRGPDEAAVLHPPQLKAWPREQEQAAAGAGAAAPETVVAPAGLPVHQAAVAQVAAAHAAAAQAANMPATQQAPEAPAAAAKLTQGVRQPAASSALAPAASSLPSGSLPQAPASGTAAGPSPAAHDLDLTKNTHTSPGFAALLAAQASAAPAAGRAAAGAPPASNSTLPQPTRASAAKTGGRATSSPAAAAAAAPSAPAAGAAAAAGATPCAPGMLPPAPSAGQLGSVLPAASPAQQATWAGLREALKLHFVHLAGTFGAPAGTPVGLLSAALLDALPALEADVARRVVEAACAAVCSATAAVSAAAAAAATAVADVNLASVPSAAALANASPGAAPPPPVPSQQSAAPAAMQPPPAFDPMRPGPPPKPFGQQVAPKAGPAAAAAAWQFQFQGHAPALHAQHAYSPQHGPRFEPEDPAATPIGAPPGVQQPLSHRPGHQFGASPTAAAAADRTHDAGAPAAAATATVPLAGDLCTDRSDTYDTDDEMGDGWTTPQGDLQPAAEQAQPGPQLAGPGTNAGPVHGLDGELEAPLAEPAAAAAHLGATMGGQPSRRADLLGNATDAETVAMLVRYNSRAPASNPAGPGPDAEVARPARPGPERQGSDPAAHQRTADPATSPRAAVAPATAATAAEATSHAGVSAPRLAPWPRPANTGALSGAVLKPARAALYGLTPAERLAKLQARKEAKAAQPYANQELEGSPPESESEPESEGTGTGSDYNPSEDKGRKRGLPPGPASARTKRTRIA